MVEKLYIGGAPVLWRSIDLAGESETNCQGKSSPFASDHVVQKRLTASKSQGLGTRQNS